MAELCGRIHSVETFGAVDGPGVRYVVFFQGCPLRCLYCHNPDSRERQGGKVMSVSELVADIESYRSFLRSGGVTLSGGEPLFQPEFAKSLLLSCKKSGFHTALDTSGAVALEVARPVIDAADLLLLDIKAWRPELSIALTGRDSTLALDILNYCEKSGKTVWIRHVLVPGYTLDFKLLQEMADGLSAFRCIEKVELLPFHQLGAFKWKELGLEYRLADVPVPDSESVEKARALFC